LKEKKNMLKNSLHHFVVISLFLGVQTLAPQVFAKLNVVASTSDVGALVEAVGGTDVNLEVIAKGSQDPHFLEPKPSYMVKVSHADLVVANGLSLEVGWLPSLLQGGRNPKVNPGSRGYLEVGSLIEPIEVPKGQVSRAEGDVHPDGNPHITLDPIRLGQIALGLADRLGELDGAHKEDFKRRAQTLQKDLEEKTKNWQARVLKTGVKEAVAYHNDMAYFFNRFGLKAGGFLEPKPGIPPTAQHLMDMIKVIKNDKIPRILVENFFDTKIADRLKNDVPEVKVSVVGVAVGSKPELKTNADVIEQLVQAIEGQL
jgi:zinc/manganese transport system substrate-binding protein